MDDLNYLLFREQSELLHAQTSACVSSRRAHHALADAYGKRIRDHRLPYRTPTAHGASFDLRKGGRAATRAGGPLLVASALPRT